MSRGLMYVANDIFKYWPKPYFGAVPYMHAMACMGSPSEMYGADSGREIVLYFLANAKTWRRERPPAKGRIKGDSVGMTPDLNAHARRVAHIARELAAALDTYPKLAGRKQASLARASDELMYALDAAWNAFIALQWAHNNAPKDNANDQRA